MNTSLIKSALAMTAAFAVGSALATESIEPIYGATFDRSPFGNVTNDWDYAPDALVTNYHDGASSGWFTSSDGDQSVITANGGYTNSPALKLQTEGGILENRFSTDVSNRINGARTNAMVRFEAQVKFVASDTLDCGVEPEQDAKFALYAYAPDGGPTNLVIFHKDTNNLPTNNVISNIEIDTEDYSAVVVEYRTTTDGESFFTVAVNGTTAVSDETSPLDDDGYWFKTINGATTAQAQITSLCFKGTGMVDELAISKVEEAQQQADWVVDSTTVSNETAAVAYPALASSALANANAGELTDWAKANDIDFATVEADTTGTLVDAFLLNCSVAEVAEEKAEFVLDITIENGVPKVTLPDDFDYNGKLQLKGSTDLSTWTPITAGQTANYNFFKYVLSL